MVSQRTKVFFRRLRRFFVTTVVGGVVVVMPITLLFLLLRFIFNLVTNFITPISRLFDFSTDIKQWLINLIAVGILVAAFFLIGLFVRTNMGNRFFKNIENQWLGQIPFYKLIRDTVQQLIGNKKMPFSKVVLVDVFGNDTRMTGFITDEFPNGYYTIFVPTGPNPTNGFIFHVKEHQLQLLDVKPEDAMRTIIGVGTGSSSVLIEKELTKKALEADAKD